MDKFSSPAKRSATLLDGSIPSNNVGSDRKQNGESHFDFGRDRVRSESVGHTDRSDKRRSGEGGGSQPNSEHGGSHANKARNVQPSQLGEGWTSKHAGAISSAKAKAYTAGQRDGKPWTLHADGQTRAILADCPARDVSEETAKKYRRAYELVTASGKTALEYANTKAHWDFLRTACRYCLETDIKHWRKASEHSRKAGDISSAQRRTERAFLLGVALDEQFLSAEHKTWADKAKEMKALGITPLDKSKRKTKAPTPNMAVVALADNSHRGSKLLERHAPRLAVLALTGCRPAELMKGVEITTRKKKNGELAVLVTIQGAKVSETRGQATRTVAFLAQGSASSGLAELCAERGGKFVLGTTDADYRSLNRALEKHDLSCYSFHHQVGSELKTAISTGKMTPESAAQVMGHRTTESLSYYGTRSASRGGRSFAVGATSEVRSLPVTYQARAQARAERSKEKSETVFGARPTPQNSTLRAGIFKPAGALSKGPKPPTTR